MDENSFRVRAYRNAARTVRVLGEPLASLAGQDGAALAKLPGIGKDLAGKILEILRTGDLELRGELTKKIPATLLEMMRVQGVGPKRARQFYQELGIRTLQELEDAARSGRLLQLRGMGPTLRSRILQGISAHHARASRYRLDEAERQVLPFVEYLRGGPGIETIEVAGSFRRRCDTVGDVDILVAAANGRPIADRFVAHPEVGQVLAHGTTRSSVLLRSGLQVDLRVVPRASYGADSLEAMVRACRDRGYAYMAVTDHTKTLRVAGGMDGAGFRRQGRAIEEIRRREPGLAVFKSAEVDILPDGRLDLDEQALGALDIVMVAVHSKFDMTEEAMTERVLRALRHPKVRIFAHPTGRLLGRREPYAIDMGRIARAAADTGVLLEIDAQPERLDLDDVHTKMAREAGARFVIDTDAHRVADLDVMRFGVDQARRGWLTADDVANTLHS